MKLVKFEDLINLNEDYEQAIVKCVEENLDKYIKLENCDSKLFAEQIAIMFAARHLEYEAFQETMERIQERDWEKQKKEEKQIFEERAKFFGY